MNKYTKKKAIASILTVICALSLFSCKNEPSEVNPPQTSAPVETEILGCGNNHNFVDGFCTECGKPMPGAVAEEKKAAEACPSCGAKLKKKNAFCTECGAKIN